MSYLTESAADPFLSIPQKDVDGPLVVLLQGGSNSSVSETIAVQICDAGDAGAKPPHGGYAHLSSTLQLQLLKPKPASWLNVKAGCVNQMAEKADLLSQPVDVDLAFSFLLRLVEERRSHQQEVSVAIGVDVQRAQLCTEVASDLTGERHTVENVLPEASERLLRPPAQ